MGRLMEEFCIKHIHDKGGVCQNRVQPFKHELAIAGAEGGIKSYVNSDIELHVHLWSKRSQQDLGNLCAIFEWESRERLELPLPANCGKPQGTAERQRGGDCEETMLVASVKCFKSPKGVLMRITPVGRSLVKRLQLLDDCLSALRECFYSPLAVFCEPRGVVEDREHRSPVGRISAGKLPGYIVESRPHIVYAVSDDKRPLADRNFSRIAESNHEQATFSIRLDRSGVWFVAEEGVDATFEFVEVLGRPRQLRPRSGDTRLTGHF